MLQACGRPEAVHLALPRREEMDDVRAERHENVGDEPAVATPPERFGTHDRRTQATGQHQQLGEPLGEFLRLDVIRVGPECRVRPAGVRRIRIGATAAAKRREPVVGDAAALEHRL